MQKNDLIELLIEDISFDGAGIGKYEGMAFFVKDTVIGDYVRAKVIKLKKRYGFARLMEILKASPDRVEPCCLYARPCGGCQIQQMSYESQLTFKQRKVNDNLIRLGGFDAAQIARIMEPIVGMETPFRYRNKAQFPIGTDKNGELVAGFYAGKTHQIVANMDCALGVTVNRDVLAAVLGYMRERHVPSYDEKTGVGLVRHVLIRCGFDSGELMVCIVVNGDDLPCSKALIGRLLKIPGMASISLNVNKKETNVILGDETRTIWGRKAIRDTLYLRDTVDFTRNGGKTIYQISPRSFYQVNPVQTEKLYSLALEYAGLTGQETVWDLYCGIGTISLFLAPRARRVFGVEIVEQAVLDARENARLNGIENAFFAAGKAEEILPMFYRQEAGEDDRRRMERAFQMDCGEGEMDAMRHPDVIVVDPPRKGCDVKCLETILNMQPDRVVYVSCDPATLARDLRVMCDGGYELKRGRAVDQFGQTVHVEVAVLLTRADT